MFIFLYLYFFCLQVLIKPQYSDQLLQLLDMWDILQLFPTLVDRNHLCIYRQYASEVCKKLQEDAQNTPVNNTLGNRIEILKGTENSVT